MTDSPSIAERLSELRADLAAARPRRGPPPPAAGWPFDAALGSVRRTKAWIRAHPLAAAWLSLVAGVCVGGLCKRGGRP